MTERETTQRSIAQKLTTGGDDHLPSRRRLAASLIAILCLALYFASPASAQDVTGPNRALFVTPELPDADAYRSGSGSPGERYWQQEVDYEIEVSLDAQSRRVSGSETIHYTNNSPDALDYLWLQLDQNLFRPGSRGSDIQPPDSRWRGAFDGGGIDVSDVRIEGREASYLIDDTRMRITLAEPLRPGGSSVEVRLDFSFTIPEYGADRMGWLDVEQGTVYQLAQWYPRMFVYDDVQGWNVMPYLGQGEFYLEYGDFDLEITVPRDFIVAATGELRNPDVVLTATQRSRLDAARSSDETVTIVDVDEVGRASTRPNGTGPLTWRFRAENVRDVAWAASQAFIWDAAGWEDVLNMSFYPKEGLGTPDNPGWEESTEYVRHSVAHYSERWYPYPYPVAINVAGIVGGMEYPMIVFCSVRARDEALFGVTTHEIAHEWYPMIVGSNERRHAWMDEGFTTFINHYATEAFYGEEAASRLSANYIAAGMQQVDDQPIYTAPDLIPRDGLGFLAYRKPGMGLYLLREYVLGPERFDAAFRAYTERWAYRHPLPSDFFRTIEDAAGEELGWFWNGWIFGTGTLDQRITNIEERDGTTLVTVEHGDGLLMPIELLVEYDDGSAERRRIPVEAFMHADAFTQTVEGTDVSRVTIDPNGMLPDVDRSNNSAAGTTEVSSPRN
ncbi:MAG: M1 family metallopeptidase [Rhodothermales bacterium]